VIIPFKKPLSYEQKIKHLPRKVEHKIRELKIFRILKERLIEILGENIT